MRQQFLQQFLTRTDETGRFFVKSKATGIVYFVEPIDNGKPDILWGDLDPATKKLTGDYGNKRTGAVSQSESHITPENGLKNIATFKGSPLGEIDRREREYLARNKNK